MVSFFISLGALATLGLLLFAWWQLQSIKKTNFGRFLLEIEARYGGEDILKARTILHEIYRDCKDPCACRQFDAIHQRIKKIGQDKEKAEKLVLLKNFLDFLESISYYQRKKYLDEEDICEMFDCNIPYWFKVYEAWIQHLRVRDKNPALYCEFERLAKKIKTQKTALKNMKDTKESLLYVNIGLLIFSSLFGIFFDVNGHVIKISSYETKESSVFHGYEHDTEKQEKLPPTRVMDPSWIGLFALAICLILLSTLFMLLLPLLQVQSLAAPIWFTSLALLAFLFFFIKIGVLYFCTC